MGYLLGIDVGTSGTKSVLFDEKGGALASATEEYPLYQPKGGWAEQDPEDWWNAVCRSLKRVISESGIDAAEISGVGISGQMHGLVMLDSDGNVLRRSIIWCDQRTGAQCEKITSLIGKKRIVEITANPALTGFTASKILWVMENEPEVYERCRHILLPKDFIRYRLTGEFATEVSDASGMQLLDVPNRCWSDEILSKLGIDKAYLGKVYESPEITGTVNRKAAESTGLHVGTIVCGGAGDNAAAAVGTGVVADGRAFTTIGTSGVVYAHSSGIAIDTEGRVHTFCCAVPGCWHIMGVTQGAGLSLKWFRDNFCSSEIETAALMGVDPYVLMDKEAERSPIGANGLIYLPYLMGERTPHLDPNASGVFFGLSAIHDKKHMIRAVMEGVAYSLRDCLGVINGMGVTVADMAVCGGGARSPLWRSMLADVFGINVKTTGSKEGPALGVALLAGVASGTYSGVGQACAACVKQGSETVCSKKNGEEYSKYYSLYDDIYPALKESFNKLGKLTGR